MRVIAIILGVLGGIIGLFSAISGLIAVESNILYSTRFGWAALTLAVLSLVAALYISTRPVVASIGMLISGIAGFICINLFYINTFYFLALPFWMIGAALGIISVRAMATQK